MKIKSRKTKIIVISSMVIGIGLLTLNGFTSRGSEKGMVLDTHEANLVLENKDNSIFLKTNLTKENGLSNNLSGNPYGFAKILDANYKPVATKVRVDYDNEFFNKLEKYINADDGVMLEEISKDNWLDFYKDANARGVEDYLNKTQEHTLIIRVSGTMFMDNTIKFVNLNNVKQYESIEGELHGLTKDSISQYFIEEATKLVLVKDASGYRKATSEESAIVLDLDNELKTATGSKLALKYYEDDVIDDEEKEPKYVLNTVEVYNKNASEIYDKENFSKDTMNLIKKIKNGTNDSNIKYRETSNLYNYTI